MVSESVRQRKARQAREAKERTREAAERLRHRIVQGTYKGLDRGHADDLLHLVALVEAAGVELDALPPQTRRALVAAAEWLIPPESAHRMGAVQPLSDGPGY